VVILKNPLSLTVLLIFCCECKVRVFHMRTNLGGTLSQIRPRKRKTETTKKRDNENQKNIGGRGRKKRNFTVSVS
jgi:hypothetical protein